LAKLLFIAKTHSIILIISVPLKTLNCYFTLYKIVTLPEQISSKKYFQYFINYTYFALQHSKRDYLLLTGADFSHCIRGSITIYPTNTAIYSAQTQTCESSQFFRLLQVTACAYKIILILYSKINHVLYISNYWLLFIHKDAKWEVSFFMKPASPKSRNKFLQPCGHLHSRTFHYQQLQHLLAHDDSFYRYIAILFEPISNTFKNFNHCSFLCL